MPMSNWGIKTYENFIEKTLKNLFVPVPKFVQRKYKDRSIFGVKILIMERRVLESNPIFQAMCMSNVTNCTSPTMVQILLETIVVMWVTNKLIVISAPKISLCSINKNSSN